MLTSTICIKYILLLALFNLSLCLFKVTSPIISELNNNQIPYSLANFGEVHYGTTLKGKLAISPESPNLCNSIPSLKDSNTILLSQRGQCSFVKKVINGQKAGAKMVIISDNIVEDSAHITMADDGNGQLVHIPSIFISQKNGQTLQSQLHRSQIQISIRFDVTQTEVVDVNLYLNINDRHSAVLARELKPAIGMLLPHIKLNISYYSQSCTGCGYFNCYGSNQYCINQGHAGAQLIGIQLSLYGVFLKDIGNWFQLYDQYDRYCGPPQYQTCYLQKMQQLKIQQQQTYQTVNKTKLLQDWKQDSRASGIFTYPAAKVNGIKYLGNADSEDIVEMICASLKNPPMLGCGDYDYLDIVTNRSNTLSTVLWSVFISLVVVLLIIFGVCVYKKTVKKEITNEMSLKVTEMVTQYIKLASDQERKTRNKEIQNSRQDL